MDGIRFVMIIQKKMARLTVFVVLAAVLGLSSALFVKIEPREEKCFYYDFIQNSEVQISLSVSRGGLLDIRYKVCSHTEHSFDRIVFL